MSNLSETSRNPYGYLLRNHRDCVFNVLRVPHIRFHELRHSCASMLIAMGFTLKDVQEWLGHSDVKMTANIYAHLGVTRKNSIADSLTERFDCQNGRQMVDKNKITA